MSASAGSPTTTPTGLDSGRRAEIRAEVASASKLIAPLWPADSIVAVNPLLGLLDRPFEEAIRVARRELGACGYRELARFRADLASGRISHSDLEQALLESVSGISTLRPIKGPGGEIDPIELLLADLIHAPDESTSTRLACAAARCDTLLDTELAGSIDRLVAGWLAAYCDEGSSNWRMPGAREGFYRAFRAIAPRDRSLRRLVGEAAAKRLGDLPDRPEDAIDNALVNLGVPGSRRTVEIRAQLVRLLGWAGYLKWRSEWAPEGTTVPRADLVELAAVRMTVEAFAVTTAFASAADRALEELDREARATASSPGGTDSSSRLGVAFEQMGIDPSDLDSDALAQAHATLARIGADDRLAIWLRAQEIGYRDVLLSKLAANRGGSASRSGRPSSQAVFCIDVRSEGIRRNLESVGDCETLGFAGFFAVAIRFRRLGAVAGTPSCPVLLSPTTAIEELPDPECGDQPIKALDARAATEAASHAFHGAKGGIASPFALAEAGGLVAGPIGALRTFSTRLMTSLQRWGLRRTTPGTALDVTADGDGPTGFGEQEQVLFAHAALTMMGLTEGFARLIVLCGHGSHTVNNPYASSLACGACGGNSGGPNARVAAAILNREPVRAALARQGVEIPADTWFAAAEHDTTSDIVTILDRELVPPSHARDLERFEAELVLAGDLTARERAERIPGIDADLADTAAMAARGNDWAQVRPEWGLAGNAAFIIAPREASEGVDLGCRTFLHSYRADCDPDGSALEVILTAPLVVAQWINSQYYFSSVDPELFGAGDKTIHNVTGARAILQGGGGDLRIGLPWQSLAVGDDLVHEPLRLVALVEAPRERLERIIADNTVLKEMFGGGWVSLVAREDAGSDWNVRSRSGTWSSWIPKRQETPEPDRHLEVVDL